LARLRWLLRIGGELLGPLSAIVTFLAGIVLSMLIGRTLKVSPSSALLPAVMGIEVILIVTASLAFAAGTAQRVEIFVILLSVTLGLQNGTFSRVGGVNVHTTYLTGMITNLISTETEKYVSEVSTAPVAAPDAKISLLFRIWGAFVLGAAAGAALVLHFKALGMFGAALVLVALILLRWTD
jgi:uncharacterized membrane protein YoaK (UPF0700 family)